MFLECQVESDEGYQLHRHQCWELRLLPANNASFEVLHTPLSSSADPKAAGPWQAANSPATSAMTPLGPWDLLLVLQTKEVPVELPGQQWARIALQQAPQRQHKCRMIHDMYMYICKCVCIYIYIYQSLLDIDHVCSAICFPRFIVLLAHCIILYLCHHHPLSQKKKRSEAINLLYRDLCQNMCVFLSEQCCASESESQSMKLLGFCRSLRSRGRWGALH